MSLFCCSSCNQYYNADDVDYKCDDIFNEYCSEKCEDDA